MTTTKDPTPEQAAWDKRNHVYTRNWTLTAVALVAVTLAAGWWILATWAAPAFGLIGVDLSEGDPRTMEAVSGLRTAMGMLLLLFCAILLVSLPLKRVARNCDWILGSRPADDYKPRLAKPIDLAIEQVSGAVQIATVGEYVFRIEAVTHKGRFGKLLHDYQIRDLNGSLKVNYTLSYSLFEGKDALYVAKYTRDTISRLLETRTDYFKTESVPA